MKKMTKSKSSDEKKEYKWGRIITGIIALLVFLTVYSTVEISGVPDTKVTRLLLASIAAGLVVLANFLVELLLDAWQKVMSFLLVFFGKYPSLRFWFVFPVIIISVWYPITKLQEWKHEATLGILLFLYLAFLLPAALLSLLRDDRKFEKTELAKIINRDMLAQNPQATIEIAFTALEDRLRKRLNVGASVYGEELINAAFGKNGKLFYGEVANENNGVRNLFSGVYATYRNPRKHRIIEDDTETAFGIITLIELLMHIIEDARERE